MMNRNKAEKIAAIGLLGYDIYRAELPFHFWLVITIRERYSRPGSYNYSNDWEESVYIHTMQHYRYGKVHSFV
jgi:hypothetical protein